MFALIMLAIGIATLLGVPFAVVAIMMGRAMRKNLPPALESGVADPARSGQLPAVDESIENVGASTSRFLRRHPGYFTIPLGIAVALEIAIIALGASDIRLYFFPLVLPFIGYSIARSKIQHEFMRQFALANDFSYAPTGSLDGLDGSLFQIGHGKSVSDVVSGQFQGHPITLFTYTYVTGYGRSEQTHTYTVYELQFDITLPDILLENTSHTFGESLFEKMSAKEFIRLEGDFNKYFSLSIPKGYEVEALEIFTPDVMQELIEKAKAFSMEIVNGHLFIYGNGVLGTKQGLYDLYGLAQYFIEKLGPVLARMKPSAQAMASYRR
jgi:hypothetical protein